MTDSGPRLPRTVRGKRPEFFETPGVDDTVSMVLILAQELAVLRERLDTAERIAVARGLDLAAEIEAFPLDQPVLEEREQWRQDFYARLFTVARQRRSELEQKHSAQTYQETLEQVAGGDI